MNFALTPGSSPGQALAHSRRAGEGTERCFERLRIDGGWSGVLCFSLDSRVRGNDGGDGLAFGSGSRATPRCPSPLDSGFRRNDDGVLCFSLGSRVRENDARGGNDGGHGMRIGG